jgi:hypothetical protein
MPKPQVPYPQGMDRLMEVANEAIPMTSGINLEILGMVDRDQAGVLEQQRKQAVYGILASFFDSIRRYRKLQGRLMLKYINKYVPEGTLVRIVPKDGTAQFVPLAKSPDTAEFDVIVDEAPMGPNQKQAIWAMFMQMFGMMKGQMPPDIIAEFLRYAPFPATVAEKLSQAVQARAQPDPAQQQLQVRGATAKVAGDEADARKKNAEAQRTEVETAAAVHGVMTPGLAPA